MRQAAVNYVGMWRRRFEKENSKKMRGVEGYKDVRELKEAPEAKMVGNRVEEVRRRLSRLNAGSIALG